MTFRGLVDVALVVGLVFGLVWTGRIVEVSMRWVRRVEFTLLLVASIGNAWHRLYLATSPHQGFQDFFAAVLRDPSATPCRSSTPCA